MEDEPFKAGKSGDSYDDLDHKHTFNLPKNIELLAQFRQVLDNKTAEDVYNSRFVLYICLFKYANNKIYKSLIMRKSVQKVNTVALMFHLAYKLEIAF